MDIKITKLATNDISKFIELIRVFEDVFEMKDFGIPSEAYLDQLLRKNDFFVFVALSDDKIVGGLTSYLIDQYYANSSLAYIFDLAVKREFQRKGIGRLLIAEHNRYCKDINVDVVMVEADEVDEHAVDFYRSTGATGLKVVHFDYFLK
jgi:aminoglycoside 3-N-acetyltransferase I